MIKHLSLLMSVVLFLSCNAGNDKSIEKQFVLRLMSYNIHHGEGIAGIVKISE